MTMIEVTRGNRFLLLALAENCSQGKRDSQRHKHELVPVLAPVPDALDLFDELVEAVGRGDELDIGNVLNQLTAGTAA